MLYMLVIPAFLPSTLCKALAAFVPTLLIAYAVFGIFLAAVLLAIDLLAWRAVVAVFDRERLITGTHT
jgi:hypothetical protein